MLQVDREMKVCVIIFNIILIKIYLKKYEYDKYKSIIFYRDKDKYDG